MLWNIVTLFPDFFSSPLEAGLLGKALKKKTLSVTLLNPRDETTNIHKTVDDSPYGGGVGMVMLADPIHKTLKNLPTKGKAFILSPSGKPFTQKMAKELAKEECITLLCGRYEGIDSRIEAIHNLEAISVGDYVLNGGETAALIIIEAVSRLQEGFMGKHASADEESFSQGLLEYPQYTRPEEFEGHTIPDVLKSGNHKAITTWRKEKSLEKTLHTRPELLENAALTSQDVTFIKQIPRTLLSKNLYCALVHYPVLDNRKKITAVSLTNLDIHDIARCSCTYGLAGYFITTPIVDQQSILHAILTHWVHGKGAKSNPDRAQALQLVQGVETLEQAKQAIVEKTGQEPVLIATSAQNTGGVSPQDVRDILHNTPVLLVFGTSHGLAQEALALCQHQLKPIRCFSEYNHLSVRSAVSISLDRILGDLY